MAADDAAIRVRAFGTARETEAKVGKGSRSSGGALHRRAYRRHLKRLRAETSLQG